MSDFVFVLIATIITAMTSYVIFVLVVKQVPTTANFGLQHAFDEVNGVLRQLRRVYRQNRLFAIMTCCITLWYHYMRMKCRNPIGRLDAILVKTLGLVLIAMATIGPFDIIHEIIIWMKTTALGKNI